MAGDRAWSSVYAFDVASGNYRKLTNQLLVGGLSFSRQGARVALIMQTPMEPANIYVTDATFAAPRRLSNANPQLAERSKSSLGISIAAVALLYLGVAAANYAGRLFS